MSGRFGVPIAGQFSVPLLRMARPPDLRLDPTTWPLRCVCQQAARTGSAGGVGGDAGLRP